MDPSYGIRYLTMLSAIGFKSFVLSFELQDEYNNHIQSFLSWRFFFSAKESNRKVMLQGDNKDTSISVRLINVCKTISLLFLNLFFYFRWLIICLAQSCVVLDASACIDARLWGMFWKSLPLPQKVPLNIFPKTWVRFILTSLFTLLRYLFIRTLR